MFDVIFLATIHPNPKSYIVIGNPYPSSFDLCMHQFFYFKKCGWYSILNRGK